MLTSNKDYMVIFVRVDLSNFLWQGNLQVKDAAAFYLDVVQASEREPHWGGWKEEQTRERRVQEKLAMFTIR